MIQSMKIDIMNDKVLKLLQDLEHLELIRLYNGKSKTEKNKSVIKYKGTMTKQSQFDIDSQLNELRNSWE